VESDSCIRLQVHVENVQQGQMPWLGGYRNKRTGAHYLHASVQTESKPKHYEKDAKFTRDTQVRVALHAYTPLYTCTTCTRRSIKLARGRGGGGDNLTRIWAHRRTR
jgi:hypothetical protein